MRSAENISERMQQQEQLRASLELRAAQMQEPPPTEPGANIQIARELKGDLPEPRGLTQDQFEARSYIPPTETSAQDLYARMQAEHTHPYKVANARTAQGKGRRQGGSRDQCRAADRLHLVGPLWVTIREPDDELFLNEFCCWECLGHWAARQAGGMFVVGRN